MTGNRLKSRQIILPQASAKAVWQICHDLENWNKWDFNIIEVKKISDKSIRIKHREFPEVKAQIINENYPHEFTLLIYLPLSKLMRTYYFEETGDSLKITISNRISGILSFFWALVVGTKINGYLEEDLLIIAEQIKITPDKTS